MTDLERRIGALEDRAALADLVTRYFIAVDGDDIAGIRSAFAVDASFAVSGRPCGTGRDGIVAFLVAERSKMGLTNHVPNATLFVFDSDHAATGIVSAHLELVYGSTALFGAVRYHDRYRREDGRWLIAARDMRTLYLAPWRDAGEALNSAHPVRWPGHPPAPTDLARPVHQEYAQ